MTQVSLDSCCESGTRSPAPDCSIRPTSESADLQIDYRISAKYQKSGSHRRAAIGVNDFMHGTATFAPPARIRAGGPANSDPSEGPSERATSQVFRSKVRVVADADGDCGVGQGQESSNPSPTSPDVTSWDFRLIAPLWYKRLLAWPLAPVDPGIAATDHESATSYQHRSNSRSGDGNQA